MRLRTLTLWKCATPIPRRAQQNDAKGLLQALEDRFLNTVQAEVTKFNSMRITSNQTGAEFVDSVEAQAKVLENLGREVTEYYKLTRLKEGLTDKRYSQLAHSLCAAHDMTYICQSKQLNN